MGSEVFSFKWAIPVFLTILGLVIGSLVGGYTWAISTFTTKGESVYVNQAICDIRGDIREIKTDIREIMRINAAGR